MSSGKGGARTRDQFVKSKLLYQLSYLPMHNKNSTKYKRIKVNSNVEAIDTLKKRVEILQIFRQIQKFLSK